MLLQRKRALTIAAFVFYPAIAFLLLKCAPFQGGGLVKFIDYINAEMEQPFSISWSENSIKVVLIGTAIYALIWFLVITSLKNTRPGEEHGSAHWTSPGSVTRKYKARKPRKLKYKAKQLGLPEDATKEELILAAERYLMVNGLSGMKLQKQDKAPAVPNSHTRVQQTGTTAAPVKEGGQN